MNFVVKSFDMVNGARFSPKDDGTLSLIVTLHIITKCDSIPYDGCFEQVDYNVDIDLDPNTTPNDLMTQLPSIVQNWVSTKYPNT